MIVRVHSYHKKTAESIHFIYLNYNVVSLCFFKTIDNVSLIVHQRIIIFPSWLKKSALLSWCHAV